MRRLRIEHVTEYRFGQPTTLLRHRLLLRPRESHVVRIASFQLDIDPPAKLRWRRDTLDNSVALATFSTRAQLLRIESTVAIEHHEDAPLDFLVEDLAVSHPFDYGANDAVLLGPFLQPCWPDDSMAVQQWLASLGLLAGPRETFVLLDRLNRAIHESFRYEVREEPGVRTPSETLTRGAGSCRDFAALFMEACRQLGLASRFVSGYLWTQVPAPVGGATHAWADVYLPGPGWKGFDPTVGQLAGSDHIPVAVAVHPEHVPPVAGSYMGAPGAGATLSVSVRVGDAP